MDKVRTLWTEALRSPARRRWFQVGGAALGALSGWAYWYFIGCSSGGCAITSHPLNSTVYGTLMGWLLLRTVLPEAETAKN